MDAEFYDARERQRHRDAQKRAAERQYSAILAKGEVRLAAIHKHATEQLIEFENPRFFEAINRLNKVPVTISEFLDSKEFLGDQIEIWPMIRKDIEECCPDVLAGAQPVTKILAGGATGTGKTEFTRVILAYSAYLMTCFNQPQRLWGLPPSTQLIMAMISTQSGVTKRVIYTPFRHMFTGMPYIQRWVGFDKHREASLLLDQGIEIVPMLPNVQSMVGQAIFAAMLDEVNFMQIVENSKQIAGPRGKGGFFDQAKLVFDTIDRRRDGRFGKADRPSIGAICAISSTRYKDDFLDKEMAKAAELKERGLGLGIKTYRRKQYEVQPDISWKETFRVLVGNDSYSTRVLKDHEVAGNHYPENAWVEVVPQKYLELFISDPDGALRDIIGEASAALNPFIRQRHKISQAMLRGEQRGLVPWVVKQDVDLETDGMPQIDEENLPPMHEREMDWFVHVDLSKSKDRCGIAFSRTDGTIPVINKLANVVEHLPRVLVAVAISIKPSPNAEIDPADIRIWLMQFKLRYGFNIKLVSYDGYASAESILLWRKAGVSSMLISTDTSTEPYDDLKSALYGDRVDMIDSYIAKVELGELEMNSKTGVIDHPPRGSKDVSDAIAGATWAAVRNRNVRGEVAVTSSAARTARPDQNTRRNMVRREVTRR